MYAGMGEPLQNMEALLPAIRIICHPLGLHFAAARVCQTFSAFCTAIFPFPSLEDSVYMQESFICLLCIGFVFCAQFVVWYWVLDRGSQAED